MTFYPLQAQQKTNITPFVLDVTASVPTITTNPDIATALAFASSSAEVTLRARYSGSYGVSAGNEVGSQAASPVDDGGTIRYIASDSSATIAQITAWDTSVGTPLTTYDAHVLAVRSRHRQTPDASRLYSCLSDVYGLRIIPFYVETGGDILVGNKYIQLANFVVGGSQYTFRRLSMASTPVIVVCSNQDSYLTAAPSAVTTSGFTIFHRDFAGALASSGVNGFLLYTERRSGHADHESQVLIPHRDATIFYVPVSNSGTVTIPAPYSSYFSANRVATGIVDVTFLDAIPPTAGDVSAVGIANTNSSTGPMCTCAQQSTGSTNGAGVMRVYTWSRTTGAAADGDFFLTVVFFGDKTEY